MGDAISPRCHDISSYYSSPLLSCSPPPGCLSVADTVRVVLLMYLMCMNVCQRTNVSQLYGGGGACSMSIDDCTELEDRHINEGSLT